MKIDKTDFSSLMKCGHIFYSKYIFVNSEKILYSINTGKVTSEAFRGKRKEKLNLLLIFSTNISLNWSKIKCKKKVEYIIGNLFNGFLRKMEKY